MKKVTVIFVLILITFLTYNFINFKILESKLNKDIALYKNQYLIFKQNYFLSQPTSDKDISLMFKWSKNLLEKKDYKLLDSTNLSVEYDSTSKKSLIFFTTKNAGNIKKEFRLGFYKYLTSKPFKVIIDSVKPNSFDCNKVSGIHNLPLQALLQNFELFKGTNSLLGNSSKKNTFYKQLKAFEKEYNEKISNPKTSKILWFTYRKGKIEIVCLDNFSDNEIILRLEKYFSEINTEYFDYSLFALRLFKPRCAKSPDFE